MRLVSILAARSSQLAARSGSAFALTLAFGLTAGQSASAQFMHESSINARPLDVDLTPNGLIAVVRANSTAVAASSGSDQRISFWRTDVTSNAKITPNLTNVIGRGNLTTSTGFATFSNAIAVNNERAILIGSADTNFDAIEDTTYVDVVAFDYTQSPPTVTVLATHALTGAGSALAGLAHDVAITPDGVLAVVTHRNWIHVFEMMTGTQVAGFNVGGPASPAGAGACTPGFSRNSLELTNDHAVVTMSRVIPSFPTHSSTWVYVVDLAYNPPTTLPSLVLEDQPFPGNNDQRKPHDLAISPNGTLAGVSSYHLFALYELVRPAPSYVGGEFSTNRRKETLSCGPVWDSIEMSDTRAVVLSNRTTPYTLGACEVKQWWTAQVFTTVSSASGPPATILATFDDSDIYPSPSNYPASFAWDLAMSDDGSLVAIKNERSDVVLLDVDTTSPSLLRLGGLGAPVNTPFSWYPALVSTGTGYTFMMNDAVAITRGFTTPSLPSDPYPGVHRWIAFGGMFGNLSLVSSNVVLYDLPQYQAGNPQSTVFTHQDSSLSTRIADIELSASQTEVLTRDTAPPDEVNPALGGRDWYRYNAQSTPAVQVGSTLGGKGTCVGVDNLIQRRGVAVSISAGSGANTGFVHVVRTF